jgi:hypothetical protein
MQVDQEMHLNCNTVISGFKYGSPHYILSNIETNQTKTKKNVKLS